MKLVSALFNRCAAASQHRDAPAKPALRSEVDRIEPTPSRPVLAWQDSTLAQGLAMPAHPAPEDREADARVGAYTLEHETLAFAEIAHDPKKEGKPLADFVGKAPELGYLLWLGHNGRLNATAFSEARRRTSPTEHAPVGAWLRQHEPATYALLAQRALNPPAEA